MTACNCYHLTAFGGFYVAPNPLPPLSLALLKEGYALLVTVGVILLFYLVGLIIARRMDKRDVSKVRCIQGNIPELLCKKFVLKNFAK